MNTTIASAAEAVSVLIQTAELGIKSGLYDIKETKYITDSIEFLVPNYFQQVAQVKEEPKQTEPQPAPVVEPIPVPATAQRKEYNLM